MGKTHFRFFTVRRHLNIFAEATFSFLMLLKAAAFYC